MLSYGSVCSGVEAATLAWEGLGWRAQWFSEIEPFPSAVLAHHWPDTPNLGDMTRLAEMIRAGDVPAPDVLVGGTPCQAFSIAGLQKSLTDPRGLLTLTYVDIANAIDEKRTAAGLPPAIVCWENVPGCLSTDDNAFGNFLAALAGEDAEFEPGPRPERGKSNTFWRWKKEAGEHVSKWPKRGCVFGKQRQLAWRVIDAQYCAVAQRRSRVFVVASARNDIDPAKVLIEFDGVRRDSPPRREKEPPVAALTATGVGTCGADDNQGQAGHLISTHTQLFGGGNCSGAIDVAACLTAKGQRQDFDVETFAVQSFNWQAAGNTSSSLGADAEKTGTLQASQHPAVCISIAGNTIGRKCGSGGNGIGCKTDVSYTLTKTDVHGVACAEQYSLTPFDHQGNRIQSVDGTSATITCNPGGGMKVEPVFLNMQVRRLTPVECERLQGMPDNHTLIPNGRAKKLADDEMRYLRAYLPDLPEEELTRLSADGPRYKAIGNSMAVPVMAWIGKRIDAAVKAASARPSLPAVETQPNPPAEQAQRSKPFLKWAGGKFSQLDTIFNVLPAGQRLIEPFAGAGSVFLNAGFASNLVNDSNPDLINLYQMLTEDGDRVISIARRYFEKYNNKKHYKLLRNRFNWMRLTPVERAAAFLYLNRHCFNGLVRYNLIREFNVGFGKYESPYFPQQELEHFTRIMPRCEFTCSDFSTVIDQAGAGDVIFCDPPYHPMPDSQGFTHYIGGVFSRDQQIKLVSCLKRAHLRGARAVITNSSSPAIVSLYRDTGFDVHPLVAKRSMNSKGGKRGNANDTISVL